jgi:hypothetical protein
MNALSLPIIHSNGTGAETLRDQNLQARSRVEDVLTEMGRMEFNRRDYYPVEGLWEKALAEREAIVKSLRCASDYFMAIAEHAQTILDEREARRAK